MREVERYKLDLVLLELLISLSSGTVLLDRGWTLFFFGVAQGVRHRVGVGILINPLLKTLNGFLYEAPVGDSIVMLGDFNTNVGNYGDSWRGISSTSLSFEAWEVTLRFTGISVYAQGWCL